MLERVRILGRVCPWRDGQHVAKPDMSRQRASFVRDRIPDARAYGHQRAIDVRGSAGDVRTTANPR